MNNALNAVQEREIDLWVWVLPPRCLCTWYMSRGWENWVSSTFRKANRRCHCCLQLLSGKAGRTQNKDLQWHGKRQQTEVMTLEITMRYKLCYNFTLWMANSERLWNLHPWGYSTRHNCLSYLDLLCAGAWTRSSTDIPFNLYYSVILELISPKLKLSLKFYFYYLFSGWYICFVFSEDVLQFLFCFCQEITTRWAEF